MKKLFYIFLSRPVTSIMLFCSMMVVGGVSLFNIPLELTPEAEHPRMSVILNWPGVTPETMEALVTSQVEGVLATIRGIKKITSTSSEGNSNIELEFHPDIDIDMARLEINEKMSSIRKELPYGVSPPSVQGYVPEEFRNLQGFLQYTVSSNESSNKIRKYLKENVLVALKSIDGVADVIVWGGTDREVNIIIDYDKAQALGISNEEINLAVSGAEKILNAGTIRNNSTTRYLKIMNTVDKVKVLEDQMVRVNKDGSGVRLKDIGRINDRFADATNYYRINGKETVNLVINKENGYNTIEVAKKIADRLEKINKKLPPGYKIEKEYDSSEEMKKQLDELYSSAVYSLIIITAVLLIIFRRIRYSLLVVSSILFSLVTSFLLFYLFNINLNVLTLSAFIIGFGFMVDNSIVVVDYLDKHYTGQSLHRLAIELKNIFFPVFASTLTTIAVFIPLTFLTGELKIYFSQFAISILFTLTASIVVSFTFVPIIFKKIPQLQKTETAENKSITGRIYGKVIKLLFRFKKLALSGLILLIGLPVWLIPSTIEVPYIGETYNEIMASETYEEIKPYINYALGGAINLFFNHVSRGEVWQGGNETYISIHMGLPNGNTIERMNDLCFKIESEILAYRKDIKSVIAQVRSEESAFIRINFTKEQAYSSFPYMLKNYLTAYATRLGGLYVSVMGFGPGFSSGYGGGSFTSTVTIKGFNYKKVKEIAVQFKNRIITNPRIDNVDIDRSYMWGNDDVFEVVGVINRAALSRNNINIDEIIASVNKNTDGMFGNNSFYMQGEQVRYNVKYSNFKTLQLEDLKNIIITSSKGDKFKLRDLIDFTEQKAIGNILREDQQYVRYVGFEYKGPMKYGMKFIENTVKKLHVPEGYSVDTESSFWRFNDDDEIEILKILLFAVLLIFMITASLFESYKQPLIILIAIPYALVGTIFLFFYGDYTIDRGAYAGMLLLIGLSVNNSIILVDYLKKQVKSFDPESIGRFSYNRLRPIFTTTLTTVAALVPLLLNPNDSFWKSLSLSITGGVIISAVIVVIYIPLFFGWSIKKIRKPENLIL